MYMHFGAWTNIDSPERIKLRQVVLQVNRKQRHSQNGRSRRLTAKAVMLARVARMEELLAKI